MSEENRTEQALCLISNALTEAEVRNIIAHYRGDALVEYAHIEDAGLKRIEELQ